MKFLTQALLATTAALASISAPAAASDVSADAEGWKYQHSVGQIRCNTEIFAMHWIGYTATVFEQRDLVFAPGSFKELGEKRAAIQNCNFYLFGDKGEKVFKSKFWVVGQGGDKRHRRMSNVTNWAILKLKKPVPAWAQPVRGSRAATDLVGSDISIPVFEKFAKGSGSVEKHCVVEWVKDAGLNVQYQGCEMQGGGGGAPLVVKGEDGPVMIGMHTWQPEEKDVGYGVVFGEKLWEQFDKVLSTNEIGAIPEVTF
ncbi:hypothetical protein [Erythrobacter aureus]|uniref:Uncharacterized protein n=1 Tax=Erythrobacter aureus TaxID=2182384 RepID=A0A345YID8_9SPHN|nr:hypothetical protein [Erythrobacter aureus]AXK43690.1 hypothetical protein DVR09_14620 [Erythrobacter aureus]